MICFIVHSIFSEKIDVIDFISNWINLLRQIIISKYISVQYIK